MKRFLRLVFNALTVLLLLVCLATVVMWVWTAGYYDRLIGGEQGSTWVIRLEPSGISMALHKDPALLKTAFHFPSELLEPVDWQILLRNNSYPQYGTTDRHWSLAGVSFYSEHHSEPQLPTLYYSQLTISYWLIVLLSLILPVSRIRFRKRPRGNFARIGIV